MLKSLYIGNIMPCCHATQFAVFLSNWLQNSTLRFTKLHQLPTPCLDPYRGYVPEPTGEFRTPNSMRLPHNSRSKGRPSAKRRSRGEEGKRERCIALDPSRPADLSAVRSAVSSSSGV